MELRNLKELRREILELRILKELQKLAADSTRLTVEKELLRSTEANSWLCAPGKGPSVGSCVYQRGNQGARREE